MQFVKPLPFTEAVDKLGSKTVITSTLNSYEWADLPVALRERAFFSSRVESARFLQRSKDFIQDFLSGAKGPIIGPDGVERIGLKAGSRAQFVKEMREFAIREGMGPLDPADKGTVRDITSETRLNLIFNTQTQAANDFGNWKQGQDPSVLNEFPAQRFIREMEVKVKRPEHMLNEGRVELKSNLEFWLSMNSDFGVPWGPWGFNSGMGVEDVDRDAAEAAGLIQPGERARPIEKDFNDRLEASTRGLDPKMLDHLKSTFGDQVAIDGDRARWTGQPAAPRPQPAPVQLPSTPAPAPVTPSTKTTLENALTRAGVDPNGNITIEAAKNLIQELKEPNPAKVADVIEAVNNPMRILTEQNITTYVQEFLDFLPPEKVAKLSKLKITAEPLDGALGIYRGNGNVGLNPYMLKSEGAARKTAFHELMHWFHMEGDPQFRSLIRQHFNNRTKGEDIQRLEGYDSRGKRDKWYDAYAGTIYQSEPVPMGLEVPTRYIEFLARGPEALTEIWNDDPFFRETFLLVLKGLFK